MASFLTNFLVPRSGVEVCEAVSEGRTVVLVEGEGRASSILVASLGRDGLIKKDNKTVLDPNIFDPDPAF
jgi:hypothetical protein